MLSHIKLYPTPTLGIPQSFKVSFLSVVTVSSHDKPSLSPCIYLLTKRVRSLMSIRPWSIPMLFGWFIAFSSILLFSWWNKKHLMLFYYLVLLNKGESWLFLVLLKNVWSWEAKLEISYVLPTFCNNFVVFMFLNSIYWAGWSLTAPFPIGITMWLPSSPHGKQFTSSISRCAPLRNYFRHRGQTMI